MPVRARAAGTGAERPGPIRGWAVMRVGVDLTCITSDFDGGKDQVVYNLLRGLEARGHGGELVVFCYEFLRERVRAILPSAEVETFRRLRGKKLMQDLPLRTFVLPGRARARRLDLLLFPKYYTGLRPLPLPTVVIPHDIQFRAFPERFPKSLLLREHILYGLDFRLRDCIVAVSDFDAAQIRSYYPRWAAKVVRIYNPIQFKPVDEANGAPAHSGPYLLSVNIAYPHKNILTLLQAFDLIRDRIPHDLILVGRVHPWNASLREFVDARGLGGRVLFTGFVDDARVRSLIEGAALYVNPSLYEGFGMTPIEAMGAGVPVVSSRETALPETTQGLAAYYEPARDPEALAACIAGALENPPSRAARKQIQEVMRATYDHRVIADEYWELFHRLVERGRA